MKYADKYKVITDDFSIPKGTEIIAKELVQGLQYYPNQNKWFGNPELLTVEKWFEPVEEFQVGDWIKNGQCLCRITGRPNNVNVKEKTFDAVGFSETGQWCQSDGTGWGNVEKWNMAEKDKIEQALIKEAKRRGFGERCQIKSWTQSGHEAVYGLVGDDSWYYDKNGDRLTHSCGAVYEQGQWAQVVDEPIVINGIDVEWNANKDGLILSCGDRIAKTRFEFFFDLMNKFDLEIHRNGENITSQIKQINERIQ